MRDEVRHAVLWTVACALLFYWFVAFTAKNVVTPSSYAQTCQVHQQHNKYRGFRFP